MQLSVLAEESLGLESLLRVSDSGYWIPRFLLEFLRILSGVELGPYWCDADRAPEKFNLILILSQKTQALGQGL